MKKYIITSITVFVLLILMSASFYIVYEDEVAVVKTLGRVVAAVVEATDAEIVDANLKANGRSNITIIQEKGLHFKIPFIQTIEKYEAKYLTYSSTLETINTKDNKRIEIQMYAQYRVVDPITFKLAVGTIAKANSRMDELVYLPVIQSANSLDFVDFFSDEVMSKLLESKQAVLNQQLLKDFGIDVIDIGINRKNFPLANEQGIEDKMTLEILKESEKLKAEGDSEYIQAQAATDREKAEIVSAKVEEAAIVKADADAEAIRIYQESLSKDLEFYQFITRMEIYKQMKDTTIFVDQDNDIFSFLNGYNLDTAPAQ